MTILIFIAVIIVSAVIFFGGRSNYRHFNDYYSQYPASPPIVIQQPPIYPPPYGYMYNSGYHAPRNPFFPLVIVVLLIYAVFFRDSEKKDIQPSNTPVRMEQPYQHENVKNQPVEIRMNERPSDIYIKDERKSRPYSKITYVVK